jgi:hypothetical protein
MWSMSERSGIEISQNEPEFACPVDTEDDMIYNLFCDLLS